MLTSPPPFAYAPLKKRHPGPVEALACDARGHTLAVAAGSEVLIVELPAGRLDARLQGHAASEWGGFG